EGKDAGRIGGSGDRPTKPGARGPREIEVKLDVKLDQGQHGPAGNGHTGWTLGSKKRWWWGCLGGEPSRRRPSRSQGCTGLSNGRGNVRPQSHNTFRRRSRSSDNAREGPMCVTCPRSSATVRSDKASARSRW